MTRLVRMSILVYNTVVYNNLKILVSTVVCVVVAPFILDIRLVDAPAGINHTREMSTQDFSTFLLRCLT